MRALVKTWTADSVPTACDKIPNVRNNVAGHWIPPIMLAAVIGALAAITSLSSAAHTSLEAAPLGAAAWFGGVFLLSIGLLVLSERALRLVGTVDRVGQWPARHPKQAAVLAGVLGTLVAMFPLLLGRSVVSPMMGPVNMLYDQPPSW